MQPDNDRAAAEIARLTRRLARERASRHEAEAIAEKGLRDLYSKKQELQFLAKIAVAANQTTRAAEVLQSAIIEICAFTHWEVGHTYLADGAGDELCLRSAALWHAVDNDAIARFRRLTEDTEFRPGIGLPGRVLMTGKPAWILDVTADDNFPRHAVAAECGLRGASAFPVLSGNDVLAVLEFFATDTREPDETLLDLMAQIGLQLGRVIERQRAEERAKRWTETLQQNETELARRVEERTAELEKAQDELVRSERLSALGQVTATVAHELRNPLSAIKNTIYSIKERTDQPTPPLTRQFERIERSINRCDAIISALLEYSRSHQPKPYAHRFDKWLRETMAEQTDLTDIAIEFDLKADQAIVNFDSDLFRRVIGKLIENAVQALAESRENRPAPRLTMKTRMIEGWLELCVDDNGPGISPENLGRVFEPLFSTKSFGTGLGLPIVKRAVEQHGGEINLSSVVNSGTTVSIRLPVIKNKAAA